MHTTYWDAVGNPALVVPIGFTDAGLPLSLQLAGKPFDEVAILRAGHAYQQTTDWHRRVPDLVGAVRGGRGVRVTDEQIVTALLATAGLQPSPEETAAFVAVYPMIKGMVELLHTVDVARYENMCLTFPAEPVFADWS